VGVKEEFLFRGICQNLLEKKFGCRAGLLASTLVFTVWHMGVVEDSLWSYANIFLAGGVLGLVYARSGSMLAVVVLHTAYDALFALPALLPMTLHRVWALPLSLLALFVLSHAPVLRCVTCPGAPASSPGIPAPGR
jgi:membrane protease YdiL (CAAX protease family)